jgi:hypothetical protein
LGYLGIDLDKRSDSTRAIRDLTMLAMEKHRYEHRWKHERILLKEFGSANGEKCGSS